MRIRLITAGSVFVLGVLFGFLFHVLDTLPATVPVAASLLIALALDATVPDDPRRKMLMATTQTRRDERLLIGGEWVEATGSGRFDVTNPANGEVVGSTPDATADDVRAAINAAAAALEGWRDTTALVRARLLRKSAEVMRERVDEIGRLMTLEQGKPLAEARGEVEYAASFMEWFAGEAERTYGEIVPPQNANNRVLVLRQGVGVVASITPWNFPAAMMTRKLGPAMAAGCTSIVKPASATPLTAAAILRCIEDAGVPKGVVNLVTSRSSGMVSRELFGDPRVRKISFTGSTEVGKELIRLSADGVKKLSLELGGHAPYVIFDDADLDEAVDGLIASKFRNAGPDLRVREPRVRPARHLRRGHRSAWPRRSRSWPWATVSRTASRSAR